MKTKINRGQFNTKNDIWLKEHICDFIKKSKAKYAVDPFAGQGDLLDACKSVFGFKSVFGLDIDKRLNKKFGWEYNDSLDTIPKYKNSIIITNPPYLAKNSAKRKKSISYKYFKDNDYQDLYQIGLEKCLESTVKCVVAIIPETFILSNVLLNHCVSITVLEDNPFDDTDCPIIVACFNKSKKQMQDIKMYKNNSFICNFNDLPKMEPKNTHKIIFNKKDGNIGIRGIDGQSTNDQITFCKPSELDYDLNKICVSSRAITVLDVPGCNDSNIDNIINNANDILYKFRDETKDILLAPFKGNNKDGKRRRRLDFKTARAIMEQALDMQKEEV